MGSCSSSAAATIRKGHNITENLIRERRGLDWREVYEIRECLGSGEGGLSTVYTVRKKRDAIGGSARTSDVPHTDFGRSSMHDGGADDIVYCVKELDLSRVSRPDMAVSMEGEIDLLSRLDHPGIIRIFEVYKGYGESQKSDTQQDAGGGFLAVVMEHCPGGVLMETTAGKEQTHFYSELQAVQIIRQIVEAVSYLHENDIVLRDLKVGDIMVSSTSRTDKNFQENGGDDGNVPTVAAGGDCEGGTASDNDICTGSSITRSHNRVRRPSRHRHRQRQRQRQHERADGIIVKLTDFGLAAKYQRGRKSLHGAVGTFYNMSPQVMNLGECTASDDMWSVGVITYLLLSGERPFWGSNMREICEQIERGEYSFESPLWTQVSYQSTDFIDKLLTVDPDERYTAKQALEHPWLRLGQKLSEPVTPEMKRASLANMETYAAGTEVRKLAMQVIARKATASDIVKLGPVFRDLDRANAGCISYRDFHRALRQYDDAYTPEQIDDLFHRVDVDETGKIKYTEFLAATLEAHGRIREQQLAEAFDEFDMDDTGYITRDNLRTILGSDAADEYIDSIIRQADVAGDGRISYSEFKVAFEGDMADRMKELERNMEQTPEESSLSSPSIPSGG